MTSRWRVTPLECGIVAAGVLAFVLSFFGYYTAQVGGRTRSAGAWHGFAGWFAAVLALLGAALVVGSVLSGWQRRRARDQLVFVLFAIAAVSGFAALFTSGFDTTHAHVVGVAADTGHGYGYWISMAAIITGAVLALVRLRGTGRLGCEPAPVGNLR